MLILCHGKKAEHPYLFKTEGIRVYSLEEICFLLLSAAAMPTEDIFCEELADFVSLELGLDDLCSNLKNVLKRRENVQSAFAREIFAASGYASSDEVNRVLNAIHELEGMPELMRKKRYADEKVREGRLYRAIFIYDQILKTASDDDINLRAGVLHNKGVAYVRMFLFESAAECFKEAYVLTESEESLDAYRRAVYLSEENKELLIENRLITPRDVSEISAMERSIREEVPDEGLRELDDEDFFSKTAKIVRRWKVDYLKRSENGLVAKDFWSIQEKTEIG